MTQPGEPDRTTPLRVAVVPGIMPDRWARVWEQRHPTVPLQLLPVPEHEQLSALREDRVEMAFVRDADEHQGLHLIPLYEELSVVVLPREHPWAEAEELALADLSEEHLLQDAGSVPGWDEVADEVRDGNRLVLPEMTVRQSVEVVASGTGIIVVPMSVARVHQRKDVVAVPVTDLPLHPVGLAWPRGAELTDPRIEDFIGVVRGRTARSSRGAATGPSEPGVQPGKGASSSQRTAGRPAKGRSPRGASGRRGGRGRRR